MSILTTEAIVLHAFDYRETSRILRLATREAGVRSVIARGARRSNNRFGAALDLFAEGSAQIVVRGTGDLHTLAGFDVARARPGLAAKWDRFAAANALSEILLRFASDDAQPSLFDAYSRALGTLEGTDAAGAVGLASAWGLAAELGFAPSLDQCASCGTVLTPDATVKFSHRTGGALCELCALQHPGARTLPPDARATIIGWIGNPASVPSPLDPPTLRSHMRLLREFLHEHIADDRPLRAFAVWERGDWNPK